MKVVKNYACAAILVAMLAACTVPPITINAPAPGISGQTRFDATTFLVVHDTKSGSDAPRLGLITTSPDRALVLRPVLVKDWVDPAGPANDLESVCAIPARENEFIVMEAGTWKGQFGRLFHISVDAASGTGRVLGSAKLPVQADTTPAVTGDQFEGLVCMTNGESHLLLILGERGGSMAYPTGVLRWADFDLKNHVLKFDPDGLKGIKVEAPGNWTHSDAKRDISDLYLDPDNRLWISATEELDDPGTFYSVIYEAGVVAPDDNPPIRVHPKPVVWREIAGFKIEGLAAPSSAVPESVMSFGTEDEIYGGVWRAIR